MPSSRSRPFLFSFFPCGKDAEDGAQKYQAIPINAAPVEIENDHFKGKILLIHDTGSEPWCAGDSGASAGSSGRKESDGEGERRGSGGRKGVKLQMQGKFKHTGSVGLPGSGVWCGGELSDTLKLGWIMNNVVQMCAKYARKRTQGNVYINVGNKLEKPHMAFPVGILFIVITTPPGSTPPELGSPELSEVKWQGPGEIAIDTESTYTLLYSTPYLDLFSWDLLKIPGVSPLPIESILGNISASHIMLYDLGVAGSHGDWRKGALVEWYFVRGSVTETQTEEDVPDGAETPLEDASDASEVSEQASEADGDEDEEDALIDVDEQGDAIDESDSSEASTGDDEDYEEMSAADSEALFAIAGWRPREFDSKVAEQTQVRVPYYIEAIDRRRKRKVRVWYIFAMTNPEGGDDWFLAKAATELASLCRPRRRLRMFRRGPGARRYTCCAVKTLEQFRHVVCSHLASETKLRKVVMAAAVGAGAENGPGHELFEEEEEMSSSHMSPVVLARKVDPRRKTPRAPIFPPRFFASMGVAACGLAFAHAREGRNTVIRETLIGSIHFEGRLCEELLRFSSDGTVRCFTPYDCATPRMRLLASEVLDVQALDGLFLGRFHLWQISTALRVCIFCSATEADRDDWVSSIKAHRELAPGGPSGASSGRSMQAAATPSPMESTGSSLRTAVSHDISRRYSMLRGNTDAGLPNNYAALLMDSTRARRWRNTKRLVLNDRVLLTEAMKPPRPSVAEAILEAALGFGEEVPTSQLITFMDAACVLKAVRFTGWSQNELLAFWINVHHCLLLHGWLLLGTPKSGAELTRFYNRVSYLVGLRPLSLREIERVILRVPKADPQVVHLQARVYGRQLLGFCSMCRRRRRGTETITRSGNSRESAAGQRNSREPAAGQRSPAASTASPRSPSTSAESPRSSPSPAIVVDRGDSKRSRARAAAKHLCLPMPQLPKPPWRMVGTHACMFLGREPEALKLPKQELRAVLVLNRGNGSSPSTIPVFHAARLNSELNDVSRAFIAEFVQVQERDGRPVKAVLPWCMQGMIRELSADPEALLRFAWQFMPPHRAPLKGKTQLRFGKSQKEEPLRRSEVKKAVFTDKSLQAPCMPPMLGTEIESIGGTVSTLGRVPPDPSEAAIRAACADVAIEVRAGPDVIHF